MADLVRLDAIDRRMIEILAADGRIAVKALAAAVGLSAPSVADRLRRLQDSGVIRAFTIEIEPEALGYLLEAIVRIRPLPGNLHLVERMIQENPVFSACDKVTGEDCFIARLHVRSMADLDRVLDRIAERAETNTVLVKTRPVRPRLPPLTPSDAE